MSDPFIGQLWSGTRRMQLDRAEKQWSGPEPTAGRCTHSIEWRFQAIYAVCMRNALD